MNFARDVVDAAPIGDRALVEIDASGRRREWTFGEVSDACARLAGTLGARGVGRGDVVMTLIGSRPQWVFTMVACFRIGAVVLPCNEQLRANDLRMRIDAARPTLIVCDERNAAELQRGAGADRQRPRADRDPDPGPSLLHAEPAPAVELAATDPCLITFTSGTTGEAKGIIHGQRYLPGQALQASTWLGARRGELVWCTAASGWSKSARNAFIAPWLQGAAALLHDARFDPEQRLELLASERVNVLCMAPTEYRVIAKRATLAPVPSLRGLVAAGEALNPEVLRVFEDGVGLPIRDGYGQTETGQLTGVPGRRRGPPGLDGPAAAGRRARGDRRRAGADRPDAPTRRSSSATSMASRRPSTSHGTPVTGCVVDDDGFLFFEGRTDDVIISSGYRIGPFEVESALVSHAAVAEAAAVAAPDDERGSVVRAIVVLRDGVVRSDALESEFQEHVKAETAPYKYPRIVEFAAGAAQDRQRQGAAGAVARPTASDCHRGR